MSKITSCSSIVRKKRTANPDAAQILSTLTSFGFRSSAVVGASVRNSELVNIRRVAPLVPSAVRVIVWSCIATYIDRIDKYIEYVTNAHGWECQERTGNTFHCTTPDAKRIKLVFMFKDIEDDANVSEMVAIDYLSNASVGINSIAFVMAPKDEGRVYYTDKFMDDVEHQTITVLDPTHRVIEKAEKLKKKFPPPIALTFTVVKPLVVIKDNHFEYPNSVMTACIILPAMDFWFPGLVHDVIVLTVEFLSMKDTVVFRKCCSSAYRLGCSSLKRRMAAEMNLFTSAIVSGKRQLSQVFKHLTVDGLHWVGLRNLFDSGNLVPKNGKRCLSIKRGDIVPDRMIHYPMCPDSIVEKIGDSAPLVFFLPDSLLNLSGLLLVQGDEQSTFVMSFVLYHFARGKRVLILTDMIRFGLRQIGFQSHKRIKTRPLSSHWDKASAYDFVILHQPSANPFGESLAGYISKMLAKGATIVLSSKKRAPERIWSLRSASLKLTKNNATVDVNILPKVR
jgi:hypothetical protein